MLRWVLGPVAIWTVLFLLPLVGYASSLSVLSPMQVGNLQEVKSALASVPLDQSPIATPAEIEYLQATYKLDAEFSSKLPPAPDCISLRRYRSSDASEHKVLAVKEFDKQDLLETDALMGSREYSARFALLTKELGLNPDKFVSIATLERLLADFQKSPDGRKTKIDQESLATLTARLHKYMSIRLGKVLPESFKDILAYNLTLRRLDKSPGKWHQYLSEAKEVCSSGSRLDLAQNMGRRFSRAKGSDPQKWVQAQISAAQALGFQAVQAKPPQASTSLRFRDPKKPEYIFEMSLPLKMAKGGKGFAPSKDLKAAQPNKVEVTTADGTQVTLRAARDPKTGNVTVAAVESNPSPTSTTTLSTAPTQVAMLGGQMFAEVSNTKIKSSVDLPSPDGTAPADTNRVAMAKGDPSLTSPNTVSPNDAIKSQGLEIPQKVEQELKAETAKTETTLKLKAEAKQEQTAEPALRKHEEIVQTEGEIKLPGTPFIIGGRGHFTNSYNSNGNESVNKTIEGFGKMNISQTDSVTLTQKLKYPDETTAESHQTLQYDSRTKGGTLSFGGERISSSKTDAKSGKNVSNSYDYKVFTDYQSEKGLGGRITLGMGSSEDNGGAKEQRTSVAVEGRYKAEDYTASLEAGFEEVRSNRDADTTRVRVSAKVEGKTPGNFVKGEVVHDTRSRSNTVSLEGHVADGRLEGGMKLTARMAAGAPVEKTLEASVNIRPEDPDDSSYWRIRAAGNPKDGTRGIVSYIIPLGPSSRR